MFWGQVRSRHEKNPSPHDHSENFLASPYDHTQKKLQKSLLRSETYKYHYLTIAILNVYIATRNGVHPGTESWQTMGI